MSEFRANVVDNCGHCGAILTLETQNSHNCPQQMEAIQADVRKAMNDTKPETNADTQARVRALLDAAEGQIIRDVQKLEFGGLVDNHVLHHPDLNETVKRTFDWLRAEPCFNCLHIRAAHFEKCGAPKWCCDGCNGYIATREAAEAVKVERPKVVCFCGSTRFTNEMLVIKWEFEKQNKIVMTWNYLPQGYGLDSHIAEAEGVKEQIDELHKRKIDMSDEVFVINLNGYIGESTRSEIEYAESVGKPVNYLEPQPYRGGSNDET